MFLSLSCLTLLFAGADYPRADLLIEAADLAKQAKGAVRILDVRPKKQYSEGHVPGAVSLDLSDWSKAFATDRDLAAWSHRLGVLGIDRDTSVVVYDDSRSRDAARVWTILRFWGVKEVQLLNGGWPAWVAAGGKKETDTPTIKPTRPELKPQPERLATKEQILNALKEKPQIIDARSSDEYCGKATRAKKNGAIPGARHLEWSDTLDPKTGKFKSAEELTKLFKDAGIDPKAPATTYCQSGGRAAVMAFALELMGGKQVRNYYRSWAEWGNANETPIEKPRPGKE